MLQPKSLSNTCQILTHLGQVSSRREDSLSIDMGRISARLTICLTSLEMYSKLDGTILNIKTKCNISKLVKQEVGRTVILPLQDAWSLVYAKVCR